MLSLSPRYDLFRFHLPKTFLPKEVEEKYTTLLQKNNNTMHSAIDYLNESIQGVSMPGISELTKVQQQAGGHNRLTNATGVGHRLNVEPMHEITYVTAGNPLEKLEKEFKVTFRKNQGLYNYFMLYETAFYYACREFRWKPENVMFIEILNEEGLVVSKIKFLDVHIEGIEGQEFNYSKLERDADTFDVTFKFNNIDFEHFVENDYKG